MKQTILQSADKIIDFLESTAITVMSYATLAIAIIYFLPVVCRCTRFCVFDVKQDAPVNVLDYN